LTAVLVNNLTGAFYMRNQGRVQLASD